MPADQTYSVYVICDAKAVPLYVGISKSVESRIKNHRRSQPWSAEIARIYVRHGFSDKELARFIEERLIARLRPEYNKLGNRAPRRLTFKDFSEERLRNMTPSMRKLLDGPERRATDLVTERRLDTAIAEAAEEFWAAVARGEDREAVGGLL